MKLIMERNLRGTEVKYNDELYKITRNRDGKANLADLRTGKVIHKDVPIEDLRQCGGDKERRIKGFRS